MQSLSSWDDIVRNVQALVKSLAKSGVTNVAAAAPRKAAKDLVQAYFRVVRGELESLGVGDLDELDGQFQTLLQLANRVSRRSTFLSTVKGIKEELERVEGLREVAIGTSGRASLESANQLTNQEQQVVATLQTLVPAAALSYQQAVQDLQQLGRFSFRGTAAELREALREVLDHLAPDAAVSAAPGFKLEAGQTTPTMRQKARFILRSRGQPKNAIDTAEKAVELVDELVASLVRSIYTRASISTHTTPTVGEVRRIKSYVDTLLVDILAL
jgi:hypothetical protein